MSTDSLPRNATLEQRNYTPPALEWALRFAAVGWRAFPLEGKQPRFDLAPHWSQDATTDPKRLAAWAAVPGVTGFGATPPDGTIGLDFDHDGGKKSGRALAAELGAVDVLGTSTPGGGWHRYYRFTGDGPPRTMLAADGSKAGETVRAGAHYLVLPGSLHPDGGVYEADAGFDPAALPTLAPIVAATLAERWAARGGSKAVAGPPDGSGSKAADTRPASTSSGASASPSRLEAWLREGLAREAGKLAGMRADSGQNVNDTLNAVAFRMFQRSDACHVDAGEIEATLYAAAIAAGETRAKAVATLASARRAGLAEPIVPTLADADDDGPPTTPDGDGAKLARRLAALHSPRFGDGIRAAIEAEGKRATGGAVMSARALASALVVAAGERDRVAIGYDELLPATGFKSYSTIALHTRRLAAAGLVPIVRTGDRHKSPTGELRDLATLYNVDPLGALADLSANTVDLAYQGAPYRSTVVAERRTFAPAWHDAAVHPLSVRTVRVALEDLEADDNATSTGDAERAEVRRLSALATLEAAKAHPVRSAFVELTPDRQAAAGIGLSGAAIAGAIEDAGPDGLTVAEVADVADVAERTARRHVARLAAAGAIVAVAADATAGRPARRYVSALENLAGAGGPVSSALVGMLADRAAKNREARRENLRALNDRPASDAIDDDSEAFAAMPADRRADWRAANRPHPRAPRYAGETLAVRSLALDMGADVEADPPGVPYSPVFSRTPEAAHAPPLDDDDAAAQSLGGRVVERRALGVAI